MVLLNHDTGSPECGKLRGLRGLASSGTFRGMKNLVQTLRRSALIEGISFLVLIGIAMPLKYFFQMPMAVKMVGWIHGVLFMWLCLLLAMVWVKLRWPFSRVILVFIAALLPFGPFLLDKRLKEFAAAAPEN